MKYKPFSFVSYASTIKHLGLSIIYIVCIWVFCTKAYSQVEQKGRVRLMSSGKTQVGGVQIMAIGATPTDSDAEGLFRLYFPNALPGDPLTSLTIYKKGYEIINADKISDWNLTDERTLDIVVGIKSHLDSLRRVYYNIGYSNYQKKYLAAIQQIQKLNEAEDKNRMLHTAKIDSLQKEMAEYQRKLEVYAFRFARINRDDILEHEKQAIALLDIGDIEGAIKLYEDMKLEESIEVRTTIMNENREDLKLMVPQLVNIFNLHSKKGNLAACDSLQKIILDATDCVQQRIPILEHYALADNMEVYLKILNRLLSECTCLDDVLLLELNYQKFFINKNTSPEGKSQKDDSMKQRIINRKEFFNIKDKLVK